MPLDVRPLPETDFTVERITCWPPLHDVTEEMGAMQFVPGSHKHGVFEHHEKGDPAMHLLTVDVDTSNHVVCPLRKGGATFHDKNTLHYTAPNQTDRPRLAFPVEFQVPPRLRRRDIPERPWVDQWRAINGGTVPTHLLADGRSLPIELAAG